MIIFVYYKAWKLQAYSKRSSRYNVYIMSGLKEAAAGTLSPALIPPEVLPHILESLTGEVVLLLFSPGPAWNSAG